MRGIASAIAGLGLLMSVSGSAEACVSHSSGRPFDRFYNGCGHAVIVRFVAASGHSAMSDRIPPGGSDSVTPIRPGSSFQWCNVGNNRHWTCN